MLPGKRRCWRSPVLLHHPCLRADDPCPLASDATGWRRLILDDAVFGQPILAICERGLSTGTLWEGRYKSSIIDSERYLMTCCRYIECNPVRAGIVAASSDYPWSSYGAHACGRPDDLLCEPPCYLELGKDNRARQKAYRVLFNDHLDSESLTTIRRAVNSGLVLGGERFKDEIEAALCDRFAPENQAGHERYVLRRMPLETTNWFKE